LPCWQARRSACLQQEAEDLGGLGCTASAGAGGAERSYQLVQFEESLVLPGQEEHLIVHGLDIGRVLHLFPANANKFPCQCGTTQQSDRNPVKSGPFRPSFEEAWAEAQHALAAAAKPAYSICPERVAGPVQHGEPRPTLEALGRRGKAGTSRSGAGVRRKGGRGDHVVDLGELNRQQLGALVGFGQDRLEVVPQALEPGGIVRDALLQRVLKRRQEEVLEPGKLGELERVRLELLGRPRHRAPGVVCSAPAAAACSTLPVEFVINSSPSNSAPEVVLGGSPVCRQGISGLSGSRRCDPCRVRRPPSLSRAMAHASGVLLLALALVCHSAAFAPLQLAPVHRRRPAAAGVRMAAAKKKPAVAFKGFGAMPQKLENRVPGDAQHGEQLRAHGRAMSAAGGDFCTHATRPRVRRRAVRVPVGAGVRAVLQAFPRWREVARDPAAAHAQQATPLFSCACRAAPSFPGTHESGRGLQSSP